MLQNMMCPPLPWGGWDGCGPTVEGSSNVQTTSEGSVQSPRQLQYSTDIINIIAIMAMIASPPSWPSSPHRHHGHHRLIATMAIIASSPPWPSSPHHHRGHHRLIAIMAITALSPVSPSSPDLYPDPYLTVNTIYTNFPYVLDAYFP